MKFNIKDVAVRVGGVSAGVVATKFIDRVEFVKELNPAIRGFAKLVIGAAVPELVKGKAKPFVTAVGDGFIASGASDLFDKFMPVSGAEDSVINGNIGNPILTDEDIEAEKIAGDEGVVNGISGEEDGEES